MHGQQNDTYNEMYGQQNDKYTEMHGQQNLKICIILFPVNWNCKIKVYLCITDTRLYVRLWLVHVI